MKMKKEFANDTTKFSDVKPWVEEEVGKKYSRTMKVKAMMGLVSIKLQQTYSLNNEGQIKSIINEEDLEHPRVSFFVVVFFIFRHSSSLFLYWWHSFFF